jgi:2-(1,2-epoxy-1,2-dihydrophenyl)acetyl-CoA isomerase
VQKVSDVLCEVEGGIATLTLNRPDRLNAMGGEILPLTLSHLERLAGDGAVSVVVLTGAGRGFCVGGDLSGSLPRELRVESLEGAVDALRALQRSSQLLREMPQITIAAINGPCAGAGLSWACACDLRYAAASARFATAFVDAGMSGDFGGSWTLQRVVGPGKARELYLLADRFGADEALRIGLVSGVLPDAELMSHVRGVAERLRQKPPLALRAIKQNLAEHETSSFAEALAREAERHVRTARSADAREAAKAFIEKRAPRFEGR